MAIKITKKSRDFSKIDIYALTIAPDMVSIKDVEDGTILDVDGFIRFTDTENTGNDGEVDLLAIMTKTGEVYATQSKTFMRSFEDIFEIMETDVFPIEKISGETKAGRPFVNCVLSRISLK